MRVLALLVALISLPALAADYTPWLLDGDDQPAVCQAQATQGQTQSQGQTPQGMMPQVIQPYGMMPNVHQEEQMIQQRQQNLQKQQMQQPYVDPSQYCCRHCRHNETPCGGRCVPGKVSRALCGQGPGCACTGKP